MENISAQGIMMDRLIARLEKIAPNVPSCRCCGKLLRGYAKLEAARDAFSIHTKCIVKHWNQHSKGKKSSRCIEFKGN